MSGRATTVRVPEARRRRWLAPLLSASIICIPAVGLAQTPDCAVLRDRIDAAGQPSAALGSDQALRQSRAELVRLRAYAEDSGCAGGSLFDDADSPECHALLQREEQLRQTIDRLSAQDAGIASDEERRAAIERFNAACTGTGPEPDLPTHDAVVPVDPDTPPGPAPAPVPADRVARVFCVRHCDGAYYPLAVDVPKDSIGGMDQLCQAQCPNAQASAYSGADGDVAKAQAADGTAYEALPAAFQFQKSTSATCSCREPGQSWAQALAKAGAMIEAHKGDVVVTPEVQARMEAPLPAPEPAPANTKARSAKTVAKRAKVPPKTPTPGDAAEPPNPGLDLTRAFRQSVPTL